MFRNAVVGVDGRSGGRDAIALARLLLAQDGQLTLAHVHHGDPGLRVVGPERAAADRDASRELLTAAVAEVGVKARLASLPAASLGRGLHELAERRDADLLVVGSSTAGLFGRVKLSDHTREALNGAPCAVAVAPAGYAQRPAVMREIGVGYDGSAESEHALSAARLLAKQLGAKVSALEAIELPAHLLEGPGPADERIDGDLARARRRIAVLGGVEPHAAYGNAAEELARYGASVDLLIVGSRGFGPLGRLVHGSTSARLAQTARCPLLVLTRATALPEQAEGAERESDLAIPAIS